MTTRTFSNTTCNTIAKDNEHRQYTIIRGQCYDITDFIDSHPGGEHMLTLAVGRDSTILFESYHIRSDVAISRLSSLPKVELAQSMLDAFDTTDEPAPTPFESDVFKALCRRVQTEVFAPIGKKSGRGGLLFELVIILSYVLLSYLLYLFVPSWWSALLCGFGSFWIGTGLQHTANHGGYFHSGFYNKMLGLADDIGLGASSLVWRYHHHVSHHAYTNDLNRDQDVHSSFPLLRLDDQMPVRWYHKFQCFYAPFLFCLLYFSAQYQDLDCLLRGRTYQVRFLGATFSEYLVAFGCKIIHYFLFVGLPASLYGWRIALMNWLIWAFFGSFLLSWCFIVSHNVLEAKPSQLSPQARKDWGRMQIETSTTWGGAIASFFTGGLCAQIEHHLFPGVAHNTYPAIARVIQDECQKRNIPYHYYPSIFRITSRMLNMLWTLGTKSQVGTSQGFNESKKQE